MNTHLKSLLTLVMGMQAIMGAGQSVPLAPKVPFMYVPKQKSKKAEDRFYAGKYPTLNSPSKATIFKNAIGMKHPDFYDYSITSMDNLIKMLENNGSGIRIYFGAYDKGNSGGLSFSMGNTMDKQVVLIFVASKGENAADVGSYYVISPVDQSIKLLPNAYWQNWTNNYYSNEDNDNNLGTTLEKPDQEYNRLPNINPKKYSDTRSIYYRWGDFKEFIQRERIYQNTNTNANPHGYTIDSIRIYFAVHDITGIGPNPWPGIDTSWFKNRLFLLFEFARNKDVFYIDDDTNFHNRTPAKYQAAVRPDLVAITASFVRRAVRDYPYLTTRR